MAASQAIGIAVPKMSVIVNRTTRDLDGTFNGQPLVIPAGYREETRNKTKRVKLETPAGEEQRYADELVLKDGKPVPETVIVRATDKNGQPIGVFLPDYAGEMVKRQNVLMGSEDPENPRDVEYLLGCEAWGDDISHLEQSDAVERLDRSLMADDAQAAIIGRNRHSAKITNKSQRRGRFTDERNYNPAGIKGNVG